jgi:MFS family permease
MNSNFYRVMLSRFLFVFGVQIQGVLMGWQMYALTHDPLQLGILGLVEAIPALSMALIAGLVVDHFNPLRIYQTVILVSFLSVVVAWGAHTPSHLYIAAALTGFVRSFLSPAMNSLIPRLVSRDEIRKSSAYTSTAFQMATVVGPGMAGVLLGIRGFSLPYVLAIISLVIACVTLLTVRYDHKKNFVVSGEAKKSRMHELLVGVRYVAKHPLLLSAMSLDMFAVLFGGVTALLPIFAAEILHVGPSGLGWLRAAPAFGAIIMGFYLIKNPIGKNAGKSLLKAVLGFGICILIFGVSKNYWLSLSALAVSGALDSISMVVRGAIVQLCSPENMRGRIAAVNSIFIGSSNEIGEFESGVSAKIMGTVPSVLFGGAMTIITVAVVFWKAKELRELDITKLEKTESAK